MEEMGFPPLKIGMCLKGNTVMQAYFVVVILGSCCLTSSITAGTKEGNHMSMAAMIEK
jgi:hypothetical protein